MAGELVRKAAERHLADLATGSERGLTFDAAAAQGAIDFFPLLRHYKGDLGRPTPEHPHGHPIVLQPWQRFFVRIALRLEAQRRHTAGSGTATSRSRKKNGKTLKAAGIGLLLAFFDGEPRRRGLLGRHDARPSQARLDRRRHDGIEQPITQ